MKPFQYLLFAILLVTLTNVRGAEIPPDQLVKTTIDEVLTIVEQDKAIQGGDRGKILALVEAKILPHFDFTRMTRLALGKYWRQATPEQQRTLEKEFRTLLVRTYTSAISPETYSKYQGYSVAYLPLHMQPGDAEVTVRTRISRPDAQPIPVDYDLAKAPDGWKVYDVAVDEVSLVINYRNSFAVIVRDQGIDGLIRVLAEKNRTENPAPAAAQQPK